MAGQEIVISSEDDAWRLLKEVLSAKDGQFPAVDLDFRSWPDLDIHLPSTKHEGAIKPSMMEAFIDLQTAVYRTHKIITSGSPNLRSLSQQEREKFEFEVQVEKGSSKYNVDLTAVAKQFITDSVGKMSSTEVVVIAIVISLIFAGVYAFKLYLQHKSENKKIDSDDKKTKDILDVLNKQIETDKDRTALLIDALTKQPKLQQVENTVAPVRDKIIAAVGDANGGEILGIALDAPTANALTANSRSEGEDLVLRGKYRVGRVDTSITDGFRVTLRNEADGTEITASLLDAMISSDHKQIIQEAEWGKAPLFAEIKARKVKRGLIDAQIVSVRAVPVETKKQD